MEIEENLIFEILCIDKTGVSSITSIDSLIHGFLFSESLWKKPEVIGVKNKKKIVDNEQGLDLKIQLIDTSSTLNDLIESAFIVRISGNNFQNLEKFRLPFIIHIRKRLNFNNIRILQDDISTRIANDIYPLINKLENQLRRYLVKFFITKIGVDWWEVTAPKNFNEKIGLRKNNEKNFSQLVDTDVTLIDFDDLGELVYKQTSGFNKQESIIDRVMLTNSLNDLDNLKQELQGNYTKYFKEAFQINNFEKKWKNLFEIRNKVAHNNLFTKLDFDTANELVGDLTKIINDAEYKIEDFKFSIEEKVALREATIEAVKDAEIASETNQGNDLKILGKINLPENQYRNSFKIISEIELLNELESAENSINRSSYIPYVTLKYFVINRLGAKGYDYKTVNSLINILAQKGLIETFIPKDSPVPNPAKGIRLIRK
jgi:hypothetical protein